MDINLTNYETWVVDWLDNNLSKEEVDALLSFLEKHPDIKKDVESLNDEHLMPGPFFMRGKNELKHSPLDLSISQIEELSVAELERDITPTQRYELNMALQGSQAAKKTHDSILKTKLIPKDVSYPKKESLKRVNKTVSIFRALLSTAAVIAILLLLFVGNDTKYSTEPLVAETSNVSQPKQPSPTVITSEEIDIIEESKENDIQNKDIINTDEPKTIEGLSDLITDISSTDTLILLGANNDEEILDPSPTRIQFIDISSLNIPTKYVQDEPLAQNEIIPNKYVPTYKSSDINGDRTFIHKFTAKLFRERLLHEEYPDNSAIKGYELTEAWINILNRMMETNITLTKYTDDYGNVDSVKVNHHLFNFKKSKNETEL